MDSVQNSTQACSRGYLFNVLILMLSKESCCHSCLMYFCTPGSIIPTTFLQCFHFQISPSDVVLDFIIFIEILIFLYCYLLSSVCIYGYALLSLSGQVVFLCNVMLLKFTPIPKYLIKFIGCMGYLVIFYFIAYH